MIPGEGVTAVVDGKAIRAGNLKLLGIHDIRANCLPEDKLNHIGGYQKDGDAVCMIGDGINDAPALKKADVGIAIGGIGSDIAVDAAVP